MSFYDEVRNDNKQLGIGMDKSFRQVSKRQTGGTTIIAPSGYIPNRPKTAKTMQR